MKQLFFALLITPFLVACSSGAKNADTAEKHDTEKAEGQTFGAKVDPAGAIAASELLTKMGDNDSIRVKVRGDVNAVCQAKGCWMTMQIADDQEMRCRFKDYAFFVPKDAGGKQAVVDGWAYREVVSVDMLRHYAEDEGKSKEEIEAITEPVEKVSFMADGVIIE